MTTRQMVADLVARAEEADGKQVVATIHGKKVAIKVYLSGRKVFGKRPYKYEVVIDDMQWGWQPTKQRVLTELWPELDPVTIQQAEDRRQRFERENQERREREEQERIRLEPLREQCRRAVRATLQTLVATSGFTAAEVHEAFRGAVYNVLHEVKDDKAGSD